MSQMRGSRRLLGWGLWALSGLIGGCSWSLPGAEKPAEAPSAASAPSEGEADEGATVSAEISDPTARLTARAPMLPAWDPAATEPACRPSLDAEGQLVVAERPQPLRFARDQHHRLPRLATWAYRSDAVLVAERPRWHLNQASPTVGTLWLVSCDGRTEPVPAMAMTGADFGNAAMSKDGTTLYFTGPRGVLGLDLATRTTTTVTEAPALDVAGCSALYGARTPTHHRDVVRSVGRHGRLVIERGHYCGFEGDWQGRRQLVPLPDSELARA